MGRVFDTNPRIAPNPFFQQIEDSYPSFDKNLLDNLYNMYFDDRAGFFELLDLYKGKDAGNYTIIQLPKKSNAGYIKSGGTIHIKKKNKGKFTDYCGGKVTEECIRKGKNSSNPTTRKRANFAANARKWKHEEGGTINYLNYFK